MANQNAANPKNTNYADATQPLDAKTLHTEADQTPTVVNGTPVSTVQPTQVMNATLGNATPNGGGNGNVPPSNGNVPPSNGNVPPVNGGGQQMPPQGPNGAPYGAPVPPKQKDNRPWNYLSIGGFASSFVFAPVGLALSIPALIQTCKDKTKGKGLAIAGTVIGAIGSLAMSVSMFAGLGMVADRGFHEIEDRGGFSYYDSNDRSGDDFMRGGIGGGMRGYDGYGFDDDSYEFDGYDSRPDFRDRNGSDSNDNSRNSDSDNADSNKSDSNKSDSNKSNSDKSGSDSGNSDNSNSDSANS